MPCHHPPAPPVWLGTPGMVDAQLHESRLLFEPWRGAPRPSNDATFSTLSAHSKLQNHDLKTNPGKVLDSICARASALVISATLPAHLGSLVGRVCDDSCGDRLSAGRELVYYIQCQVAMFAQRQCAGNGGGRHVHDMWGWCCLRSQPGPLLNPKPVPSTLLYSVEVYTLLGYCPNPPIDHIKREGSQVWEGGCTVRDNSDCFDSHVAADQESRQAHSGA